VTDVAAAGLESDRNASITKVSHGPSTSAKWGVHNNTNYAVYTRMHNFLRNFFA